jgi:hypothetical protein
MIGGIKFSGLRTLGIMKFSLAVQSDKGVDHLSVGRSVSGYQSMVTVDIQSAHKWLLPLEYFIVQRHSRSHQQVIFLDEQDSVVEVQQLHELAESPSQSC